MARKPNYDFQRREREKAKASKRQERAKGRADDTPAPEGQDPGKPHPGPDTEDGPGGQQP